MFYPQNPRYVQFNLGTASFFWVIALMSHIRMNVIKPSLKHISWYTNAVCHRCHISYNKEFKLIYWFDSKCHLFRQFDIYLDYKQHNPRLVKPYIIVILSAALNLTTLRRNHAIPYRSSGAVYLALIFDSIFSWAWQIDHHERRSCSVW